MIKEIKCISCAYLLLQVCIMLTHTGFTMQEVCEIDKHFQRVSDNLTVETEQSYDLLLQRKCSVDDNIQRLLYDALNLLYYLHINEIAS